MVRGTWDEGLQLYLGGGDSTSAVGDRNAFRYREVLGGDFVVGGELGGGMMSRGGTW